MRRGDYPNKPVRLIVGFTPGSSADITARVLGNRMSQTLGQQVVVESEARRGLAISRPNSSHARRRTATRCFSAPPPTSPTRRVNPNLPFDFAKDFAPIALVSTAAVILVVHPSVGVNSVQELIALAKSKPGELIYASTGRRHRAASVRRAVQQARRRQARARALSGQPAGGRPICWPAASRSCSRRPRRCCSHGPGRHAQGAGIGGAEARRRSCPMCRRWPRPACRISTPRSGSA